jgi:peptidyl-prolyl cis-trans isomerase D
MAPVVLQAVFKAPKPQANQPSVVVIDDVSGGKIVASIGKVTNGEISEGDKSKQAAIEKNIAAAFGKAQFEAVINELQSDAEITIRNPKQ